MSTPRGSRDWTIRPVQSIAEYHACEDLQRRAWGFTGDLDIIPLTQMVAAHKAGGVVLGAFADDGTLLGFCYGFLGRRSSGELLHYSHMLAVDSEYRTAGLGAALKWAQRAAVLEQNIQWMVWTYDPLESLNGYFNFAKLGVIARTYFEDLYGETSSGLHRGTPTDRLLAEWPLASPRAVRRAGGGGPTFDTGALAGLPALLAAQRHGGEVEPGSVAVDALGAPLVTVEIPRQIQSIKAAAPELARRWRMATREALTRGLGAGYHVAECLPSEDRSYYVLRHGDPDLGESNPDS
jgi:predicted GNAT superfamily acetyltransferase